MNVLISVWYSLWILFLFLLITLAFGVLVEIVATLFEPRKSK